MDSIRSFLTKKGSPDIWSDAVLKGRKPLYKLYISIITNKFTVMNSSFLYRACRLYQHKCLREEYTGNAIILHINPFFHLSVLQAHLSPRKRQRVATLRQGVAFHRQRMALERHAVKIKLHRHGNKTPRAWCFYQKRR